MTSLSKNQVPFQKSVLRYPGGKSRAVDFILSLIPENTTEVVSPFIGGGSVELALASKGIRVYAYDIFPQLVGFWKQLLTSPKKIAAGARRHLPLTKKQFYRLQKKLIVEKDPLKIATYFFVLNRSSFSGSTLSGGISLTTGRFNKSSIERLEKFSIKNLSVEKLDFKKSLKKNPDVLAYLDPPYLIKNTLYGVKGNTHRGFDHIGLSEILKKRKSWILSYNDCPEIRELYKGYTVLTPKWKYGMSSDKGSKEIIIISSDLG